MLARLRVGMRFFVPQNTLKGDGRVKICRYCGTSNWSFQTYCEKCAGALVNGGSRSDRPRRTVFRILDNAPDKNHEMDMYFAGSIDAR